MWKIRYKTGNIIKNDEFDGKFTDWVQNQKDDVLWFVAERKGSEQKFATWGAWFNIITLINAIRESSAVSFEDFEDESKRATRESGLIMIEPFEDYFSECLVKDINNFSLDEIELFKSIMPEWVLEQDIIIDALHDAKAELIYQKSLMDQMNCPL